MGAKRLVGHRQPQLPVGQRPIEGDTVAVDGGEGSRHRVAVGIGRGYDHRAADLPADGRGIERQGRDGAQVLDVGVGGGLQGDVEHRPRHVGARLSALHLHLAVRDEAAAERVRVFAAVDVAFVGEDDGRREAGGDRPLLPGAGRVDDEGRCLDRGRAAGRERERAADAKRVHRSGRDVAVDAETNARHDPGAAARRRHDARPAAALAVERAPDVRRVRPVAAAHGRVRGLSSVDQGQHLHVLVAHRHVAHVRIAALLGAREGSGGLCRRRAIGSGERSAGCRRLGVVASRSRPGARARSDRLGHRVGRVGDGSGIGRRRAAAAASREQGRGDRGGAEQRRRERARTNVG